MYTFLDFAMYLHSKTYYVFCEKKCTLYQRIVTPPISLRYFLKKFVILSRAKRFLKAFMRYVFSVYEKKVSSIQFALLFFRVASINSKKATFVQFSVLSSS